MNARDLSPLLTCLAMHVACAQQSFTAPTFPAEVKSPHQTCIRLDAQADLDRLKDVQNAIRAVNSLLPQVPPEEEAYIRAEKKRIWNLGVEGQAGISGSASELLRRRPLYWAWFIRDDATLLQHEIAMQHGYKNARKLTPNVDALEAQQSLNLLSRAIMLDRSVRDNMRKAGRGMDDSDMKDVIWKTNRPSASPAFLSPASFHGLFMHRSRRNETSCVRPGNAS